MRPLLSDNLRHRLQEHDPKWRAKAILQAICTFLAFIALILFADATAITNRQFTLAHGDWTDWMPIFPLFAVMQVLISLIYNPLTLFLRLFRHNGLGKPIHPGWDVGTHLVIWALGIPSIVLSVGWGWFWWWQPVWLEFDGFIPCNGWNFWSQPCNPVIYTAGKLEIAANVFLGLLTYGILLPSPPLIPFPRLSSPAQTTHRRIATLVHAYEITWLATKSIRADVSVTRIFEFTLFVLACIATHKHRRTLRQTRAASNNIRLQYNRDPEDHAAQEPPAYTPRKAADEEAIVPPTQGATKYK
ncbi:MAG: hypothetical protein Q9202_001117 [Teloschistes flavicans]